MLTPISAGIDGDWRVIMYFSRSRALPCYHERVLPLGCWSHVGLRYFEEGHVREDPLSRGLCDY